MLKKTITYVDYDGNERTEDFYFNLSRAELLDMELTTAGGMDNLVKKIINEQDTARIVELFKSIINKSVGVKSMDGKRFIKNQEVLDNFVQSEAYSVLYMELISDSNAAAEFINGIMPAGLVTDEIKEKVNKQLTDSNIISVDI